MRFFLCYHLRYLILLDLFISLECFDINSANVFDGQIFSRLKCQPNDTVMCALDQPNQTLSFVTREYCLSTCHTGFRWSWFNHIADEDPTRCMMGECQLYAQQPQNISQRTRCSLYKSDAIVRGSTLIAAICNGFQFIRTINKFYKPIFQPTFWGQATQICSNMSLNSRLIILRSLNEFQQLTTYLKQFPANVTANCFNSAFASNYKDKSGFWTAKRRTDVYTMVQATCKASPLIWIYDNSTSGTIPEQSWESAMWQNGQPDCFVNYAGTSSVETCVAMPYAFSFKLNDIPCGFPNCPLCEVDMN